GTPLRWVRNACILAVRLAWACSLYWDALAGLLGLGPLPLSGFVELPQPSQHPLLRPPVVLVDDLGHRPQVVNLGVWCGIGHVQPFSDLDSGSGVVGADGLRDGFCRHLVEQGARIAKQRFDSAPVL